MKLAFGTDHCRCSACGEYFNSTFAFDAHRYGKPDARRCRSVEEMRKYGMSQNAKSLWITKTRYAGDTIGSSPSSGAGEIGASPARQGEA